jgi:predicted RNase H-like nuclease (RuvC/YqgF family)
MTDKDKMSDERKAEILQGMTSPSFLTTIRGTCYLAWLNDLWAEIDRLKAENAELKEDVECSRSKADELERMVTGMDGIAIQIKNAREHYKARIAELEAENAELRRRLNE